MWKLITEEINNKTQQLKELEEETRSLNDQLYQLNNIIIKEVNKEVNTYIKNIFMWHKYEIRDNNKIDIQLDDLSIMINLRDENNTVLYSCKFSNINYIINNLKSKINMVNLEVSLYNYIQNIDARKGPMNLREDKITGDERYFNIKHLKLNIQNNKLIFPNYDVEGLNNFTDIFNHMNEILIFYDYRLELHKNHDVISTKKSVYYLLKHFRSSLLSSFPKDMILYICKKSLKFEI